MRVDRLVRRIDAASARLVDLRGQFRQHDPEDRGGVNGNVGRLHVLLDTLHVSESEAHARQTERRESLAASEIERRRFRDLLDLVPVAALLTTTTGLIQLANRAAADLLGVPAEWLIGKSLAAFFAERPATFIARIWQLQDADAGPVEYEDQLRLQRTGPLTARLTVSAVRGPAGEVTGLQWIIQERNNPGWPQGFHRDGPRRRLGVTPNSVPVSEERARARRELVAMIGHELMNPLNGIQLHAELLKMTGTYRENSVDVILTCVPQVQRLIDDLMGLARTDVMRLHLQPAYVELIPLLRSCIAAVRTSTKAPVLHPDAPAELPLGHWDQGRIQQVFHNLLANAAKYSQSDSEIHVSVEELGDRVRVSVIDQGIGIDAAALPHVFDRFFRAESGKDGIRGLGLGLHIAKSIVEAHGGTITAESGDGIGSVFRVTLPYEPEGLRDRRVNSADAP
jgi:PAS domain S-box-containing protein